MQQDEKKKLRETLLKRRTALTKEQVRDGSQGAVELIRTLAEWKNACEVLIYWPIRGEVDVRPLSMELWQRGCRVLMPRCRPDAYGQMDIACAACEDDLTPGAFSIMDRTRTSVRQSLPASPTSPSFRRSALTGVAIGSATAAATTTVYSPPMT